MAKMREILRPRLKNDAIELDPVELELLQARIADRVARLTGSDGATSTESPTTGAGSAAETDLERPLPDHHTVDGVALDRGDWPSGSHAGAAIEAQRYTVPIMAEPPISIIATGEPPGEVDAVPLTAEPESLLVGVGADDVQVATVGRAGDDWEAPEGGDTTALPTLVVEVPLAASAPAEEAADSIAAAAAAVEFASAPAEEAADSFADAAAAVEFAAAPAEEAADSIAADAAAPDGTRDALVAAEVPVVASPARERAARVPRAPSQPKASVPPASSARRSPASRTAKARPKRLPATIPPFCPYCATVLQPPPANSRRCDQCLQRIVVKRIEGRVVYLTEAAIPVFEAERQRIASSRRLTRERGRWLKLAASVHAPAERVARLAAARPSPAAVEAARALYVASVDRSFNAARRERRWEDASRLRREQALTLYRIAGSPAIPPAETVALHREAATAELRGIARIGRQAELRGATCCELCRSDDHRAFQIAAELATPRLPHVGCPRGLCRCRWDLPAPDRATVGHPARRSRSGSGAATSEVLPSS